MLHLKLSVDAGKILIELQVAIIKSWDAIQPHMG